MSHIDSATLSRLSSRPSHIRNLCILAHVDHGKTSMADHLLANNGLVSQKLAGKVRFLDNRPDEQERHITMKSSSVALLYQDKRPRDEAPQSALDHIYLINLIDSPGHVDFSSEVSNAVRVSDGCLLLVDVLEGVCVQTIGVLRCAWNERVKPCLVLNKMDRLIVELKLTPLEAHQHIHKLLEQINAIASTFLTADAMAAASSTSAVDIDDSRQLVFAPELGNVIFASAFDCWAFSIPQFAALYARKLSMNAKALERCLWGDYFFLAKEKRVVRKATDKASKPMFVQFILEPLWQLYAAALDEGSDEQLARIIGALELTVPQREITNKEPRSKLQAICSKWLPIPSAVLGCEVYHLPSPLTAQRDRVSQLWPSAVSSPLVDEVRLAMSACDRHSPHVMIYVSKMVDVGDALAARRLAEERANQPQMQRSEYVKGGRAITESQTTQSNTISDTNTTSAESPSSSSSLSPSSPSDRFVAFARIFSGTLRQGVESADPMLYIFAPKYDYEQAATHVHCQAVPLSRVQLYLFMANEVERVSTVYAGNVFGIGGLGALLLKTATLSTLPSVPTFRDMSFQSAPIVRVSVEPEVAGDFHRLIAGLRLLNQADANVQVRLASNGSYVIVAAGELHLERCLRDLHDRFAVGVRLRVSAPIVAFRETIVDGERNKGEEFLKKKKERAAIKAAKAKSKRDEDERPENGDTQAEPADSEASYSIEEATPSRLCTIRVRAVPLPQAAVDLLVRSRAVIKGIAGKEKDSEAKSEADETSDAIPVESEEDADSVQADNKQEDRTAFITALRAALSAPEGELTGADVDQIISFGPHRLGSNLLISRLSAQLARPLLAQAPSEGHGSGSLDSLASGLINGFQLATSAGPMCEEPMMGVAFLIEALHVDEAGEGGEGGGSLSGQVISTMRSLCRKAFSAHANSQRLCEGVYHVDLQCESEQVGNLYGVLNKRRARVLSEALREGTNVFLVKALLPLAESFGFAGDVRKRTGGEASPQLVFAHWQLIDVDPFFVPKTEQEIEEFGSEDFGVNLARRLVDNTRRRKGLAVKEKTVVHADKQRTLARKK